LTCRLALSSIRPGSARQYTRHRLPVRLVYAEEFGSVVDAFAFEKRVQGWSRRKREALIQGRRDDLPELSRSKSVTPEA